MAKVGDSGYDDKLNLFEVFTVLWRGKLFIASSTLILTLVAVFYSVSLPNKYRSSVLLAPADENAGGGLAGMAGQLSGLAGLAGVSFRSGSDDKTVMALEVLKSRDFITKFISRRDILVELMAGNERNFETGGLVINDELFNSSSQEWVEGKAPSSQFAYERFRKIMIIDKDKDTNFIRLSIESYSPEIAKLWVDWLVEDINLEIKARDVSEAVRSIEFLKIQLAKTSVSDMQTVFFGLIEEQTKIVMLSEVREEYVFKTIDPATLPERKSSPNRMIICLLGFLLGGGVGVGIWLARYFYRGSQEVDLRS